VLDTEPTNDSNASTTSTESNADINPATGRPRRRAASRPAGPPPEVDATAEKAAPARRSRKKAAASDEAADVPAPAKKAAAKRTRKATKSAEPAEPTTAEVTDAADDAPAPRKRSRARAAAAPEAAEAGATAAEDAPANPRTRRRKKVAEAPAASTEQAEADTTTEPADDADDGDAGVQPPGVIFQPPAPRRSRKKAAAPVEVVDEDEDELEATTETAAAEVADTDADTDDAEGEDGPRRRRRRGGRGRRGRGRGESSESSDSSDDAESGDDAEGTGTTEAEDGERTEGSESEDGEGTGTRRRRRRRRRGGSGGGADGEATEGEDPPNTVTRVREPRKRSGRSRDDDEVTSLRGSTRIEAKKQRRREGREAGRRRPPVLTESEFLARREAVERVMVIRQTKERTQIGVLEDGVLVEHHVSGATDSSSDSMVGNVYLGRVQNVLPSMEAAFVDIGRGRNAVLYAGEVNWDAAGLEGQPKRIEHALKSGDPVLVQVTKEPVGQKGARLTSQISLPGRYLVYVPEGSMNGISRKLPDTERSRLKAILKKVVPEQAGVIVRTAAEGASEEELSRDVARLTAQWEDIDAKAKSASTTAPAVLYGEPDLTTRVVRDIFNEDFTKLVVSGDDAWSTVDAYIEHVAPDLHGRLEKWTGEGDVFHAFRVDEQLLKALDRKVYLPSGGSLVIDRTEAMTVVDVNTGKFTGQGGNLEETVTRNNIEAAEEIVRQLRLRDVGGIIVVDFIDMVLESNRDLVLRRLLECLGRDRTKHQVAEVTSLGLVQMTRKRVGAGLLEVFSEPCDCCNGRGLKISLDAPAARKADKDAAAKAAKIAEAGKSKGKKGKGRSESTESTDATESTGAEDGADTADAPAETEGGSDKPARRGRGRGRKAAEAGPVADQAADQAPAPSESAAAEPAAAEPAQESTPGESLSAAEAAAQPAESKPRARRTRKAATRPAGAPSASSTTAEGSV
jgi:ribonuclease E